MVPRRTRRRSVVLSALAVGLGLALPVRAEAQAALTADEKARLAAGEVIRRPLDFELDGGTYFGGVSYAVVEAPAAAIVEALMEPGSWRSVLPLTLDAIPVGRRGEDRLVFLRHGGKLGTASYTAIVRRESPHLVRFWLDPSRPHEIADCWGYFRVDPLGPERSLVTFGALLHLDAGLTRLLFSEKIRSYALDTPRLLKRFVESRR